MDSFDGNKKLDAQEFFTGLNEVGCKINKDDAGILMMFLDKDASGTIDMGEFLLGIRVWNGCVLDMLVILVGAVQPTQADDR